MAVSGNVPMEDIVGGPVDFTVAPMSGEVSRWVSRMAGYGALLCACAGLAKVLI